MSVKLRQALLMTSLVVASLLLLSCAGKKNPVDRFAESQEQKMSEKSAYAQAEFDIWAKLYEPTVDDLEAFRAAWNEHGQSFPESKSFAEVEREARKSNQSIALVSVFMTSYDLADLRDKSQGWTVYPVPKSITELSESDVVLRALMPVKNPWARYFLLKYSPETLSDARAIVVGNRTSKVELERKKLLP